MMNRKIDPSWVALTSSVTIAAVVLTAYWAGWHDRARQIEPYDDVAAAPIVHRKANSANEFNILGARKSIVYIKCLVPGLAPMYGTGFLVSPDGLIYTNRHVIKPEQPIRGSIVLVGVPSPTAADADHLEFFKAEVVHATPTKDNLDFAILKVAANQDFGPFPSLPLAGDLADLASPVAVLGYPFITSNQHPLAFNKGSISATRVVLDQQAYYQTDAAVNPGNSGGPLLNVRGEAIGIVTKRKTNAAGMNYALQLKEVQAAATLARRRAADMRPEPGPLDPNHLPSLPSIPPEKAAWQIVRGEAQKRGPALSVDNDGEAYWIATRDDLPENFQIVLNCHVEFLRGRHQSVWPTHDEIRRSLFIRFGAEDIGKDIMESVGTRVQLREHDSLFWQDGKITNSGSRGNPDDVFVLTITRQRGLVTVAVDEDLVFQSSTTSKVKTPTKLSIGGILSRLHLGEASIIELEPGPPLAKYHAAPRAPFEPLVKGNYGPPILVPPDKQPPLVTVEVSKFPGDRLATPIHARIADVAVGGGGRYLVLHLPDAKELAVFDVSEAKVVRKIPLKEANARFAVGLDKVVVVLPGSKRVERYNLLKDEKYEQVASLVTKGPVTIAAMGSASRGPILIGAGAGMESELVFLDVHTLRPLKYHRVGDWQIPIDKDLQVRASADGAVFAASGQGITTLVVRGDEARGDFMKDAAGLAIPGGKLGGDLFTLPAEEGNFALRFDKTGKAAPSLCIAGDERPIAPLAADLLAGVDLNGQSPFAGDKRVHLIPGAKVIVTIPNSNDRVVLHRFDADVALEKSKLDYLFVSSLPPTWGRKGSTYRYPIGVQARNGDLKFRVIAGPAGLTVSEKGKVSWSVPANYPGHESDVVIGISSPTHQEIQHAFRIALQEQATK